tara:strand:+ start:4784 stop:5110 length:327 start_codon:yes stop_codon:yes gene_type:complete
MTYGQETKRIIFEESDKVHADLKIRLHADDLKQGEFFSLMISGYIERDERIVDFVEEYKKNNSIQSKEKRAKSKKLHDQSTEIRNKFALNEGEVESIFDLLEKECPEL